MKNLFENWNKFVQKESRKAKGKRLHEQYLAEISRYEADKVMNWFGGDYDQLSFDELFDGKLRKVIELTSDDSIKLYDVVRVLIEKGGWDLPEDPEDASWRARKFATRTVKQKLKRAGTGEEYTVDKVVADLVVNRVVERTIPAGPRQGETISREENTTMSKAIAKLAKEGHISPELLEWWQKKQVYYTNDNQWKTVEQTFKMGDDERPEALKIILSRHPMDVLRMSDISGIKSCHSEGASHFECAIAESRGHGPIAFMVTDEELSQLMSGKYTKDGQKTQPARSRMDEPTRRAKKEAAQWLSDVILNGTIPRSSNLFSVLSKEIDNPETFEFALDAIRDAPHLKYPDLSVGARAVLGDQAIVDAVKAKMKGDDEASEWLYQWSGGDEAEPEPEPEHEDISELDGQEIFADSRRGVRGIGIESRVRLRKYTHYNTETGRDEEFAVPEHRIYGAKSPGLVAAVSKWAFEQQKDVFKQDEEGNPIPPEWDSMIRYGGSYEDNKDGFLLDSFFVDNGAVEETDYHQGFNVEKDTQDERESLIDQWEREIEELNTHAGNVLPSGASFSVYTSANVEDGDWGGHGDINQPYLYHSSGVSIDFDVPNLKYADDGEKPADSRIRPIPEYGSSWTERQEWNKLMDGLPVIGSEWVEDVQTEISTDPEGYVSLSIRFDLQNDDIREPDDFDGWIDYLKNTFNEEAGSRIISGLIRLMVAEGFAPSNTFDLMVDIYEEEDWDEDDNPEMVSKQKLWKERIEGLENFKLSRFDDEEHKLYFELDIPGTSNLLDLDIELPSELMVPQPYGSDPKIDMSKVSAAIGGQQENRHSTSLAHSKHATKMIAKELNALEAEANKYAARQLKLDFGVNYDFSDIGVATIDFSEDMRLKTVFMQRQSSRPKLADPYFVFSRIELVLLYDMDDEQIEFAMNTIEYVDKNLKKVRDAIRSIFVPALSEAAEEIRKHRDEKYTNTTKLERVEQKLVGLKRKALGTENDNKRRSMLAIALWTQRVFEKMSVIEQHVLVHGYIDPLLTGELTYVNPNYAVPQFWGNKIFQHYQELGAPGQVARDYRYEHDVSYHVAWDEVADIPAGDGVARQEPVRGTLGEPIPVGSRNVQESLTKDFTRQEVRAMIREVLKARGILDETGA